MENFKYQLNSTGSSSQKYGDCEICNKPATEVFQQSKSKVTNAHTFHVGNSFGHEHCLIAIRS